MKKVKLAAALAILLALGGVKAKAQTTTFLDQQVSLTLSYPGACLNHGRGEVVNLSGKVRVISYDVNVNGIRHGFVLYAGQLTGKGQSTGINYTATGSHEASYKGVDVAGNGDYVFDDNFRLGSAYTTNTVGGVTLHDKREFVLTNSGNTLTVLPEESVCR